MIASSHVGRRSGLAIAGALALVALSNAAHAEQTEDLSAALTARFGFQYRTMASTGNIAWHATDLPEDAPRNSVVNQRARVFADLAADRGSARVGTYVQLELGHLTWGRDGELPKTVTVGDDRVGVELRRGFGWIAPGPDTLVRIGVQGWHDRFGNRPRLAPAVGGIDDYDAAGALLASSIWDFDVAGVSVEHHVTGRANLRAGVFWLAPGNARAAGDGSAVLGAADADVDLAGTLVGASFYLLHDDGEYAYGDFGGPGAPYDSAIEWWAGGRAHRAFGVVDASAFAIVNHGSASGADFAHTGVAAGVRGRYDLARAGSMRAQLVYASGDDGDGTSSTEFRTIAQSERDGLGAQTYWSYLAVTSPRGPADVTDLGIGLQNRGLGLVTAQAAYAVAPRQDLELYAAVGWLRSAVANPASGSSSIGVEAVAELTAHLYASVSASIGAAYLLASDFFATPTGTGDAWQAYGRFQLEM